MAARPAPVGPRSPRRGWRRRALIVKGESGRVIAIEVKLAATPSERDGRHLRWLEQEIGGELLDTLIVTTGRTAYRRRDGVAVVPAALLGP